MAKEAGAPPIARNSGLIGAFSEAAEIEWRIVEEVLRKEIPQSIYENLEVARRGRNGIDTERGLKVERGSCPCCSVITGNEMIGLGQFYGSRF